MTNKIQNSTSLSTPKKELSTEGPGPQPGGPSVDNSLRSFRTAYGGQRRIQITFPTEGRTKQSFKAECDINQIMSRYLKTGVLEHVRDNAARFLDVTGADFQDAQLLVAEANSMFHSLPSAIRTRFENSPAEFLKFMENPANAQEAIELGLQTAPAETSTPPTGDAPKVAPATAPTNVGQPEAGGTPPAPKPASAA